MKKLISVVSILMVLAVLIPSVTLAADPPDTVVDVVVVSGGNVDVNLNVSGGSSNISVDGVNLSSTFNGLGDEIYAVASSLRKLTEMYNKNTPLTQKQIDDMKGILNLLSDATAKLIVNQSSMGRTIDSNKDVTSQALVELQTNINTVYKELESLGNAIKLNNGSNLSEQAKLSAELTTLSERLDVLSNDTKSNLEMLANVANGLSTESNNLSDKVDKAIRIAVIATIVAVASLISVAVILVNRKAK